MLAAIEAFFVALPKLLDLFRGLIEDFKELWQKEKDAVLARKLSEASKKAASGDTSGYEDIFKGKE